MSYPGIEEHPQHELAKQQMDGFGSMIAIGVKGGLEAGKAMMSSAGLVPGRARSGDLLRFRRGMLWLSD